MAIELSICLGALIMTVALLFAAFRWYRSRRIRGVWGAMAGIIVLHAISRSLAGPDFRGYLYEASDSNSTFLEVPFKGVSYERALKDYQMASHSQLFRTFDKEWWNYYRWYDYTIHPRWNLPHRPRSTHRG